MTPAPLLIWLVDGVVLMALLEATWLLHRARRLGHPRLALVANLAAGLALMVALRLALGDAAWVWVAACLAIAGLAHVLDLRARWQAAGAAAAPDRAATCSPSAPTATATFQAASHR